MEALAIDKVYVTKMFNFDMGHALMGYDGPCKDIHGHTYHLHVTVAGYPIQESGNPKDGMVVDFGHIKQIVHQRIIDVFDHALVLNQNLTQQQKEMVLGVTEKVLFVPFQPSCENLLLAFKQILQPVFEERGFSLFSLRLYETPTSYAEWFSGPRG
jgi:6-pyruvoyltetrahydropterin/6-carboxytetrahydropterin synthase